MTLPISYFRFYFPEYVLKTRLPPNCTTGFLDSLKGPPVGEGLFCCCAENAHIAKVVSAIKSIQKAKDDSRFSTRCRLYSGALSGTRTLGPLIKSQLLYQLS